MATDSFWDKFSRWRRKRPFWGGLFLLLSALELLYTANMSLGNLQIHLGPQGFLSYLLPLLLVIAGLLCWFTPAQRLFYGIIGLLTALYSFIGLNLGGFIVGMLLGIAGGALVIAWGPPRVRPGQELSDLPPDGEPYDGTEIDQNGETRRPEAEDGAPEDVEQTRRIEIAGHDDRPRNEQLRPATRGAIVPGFDDQESPKSAAPKLGKHPRSLAVGLVVVGVSATVLVAGSRFPASADTCPAGLPSRSTTPAATKTTTKAASTATTKAAATKAAAAKTPTSTTTATASATPSASASTGSGNALIDGINSLIDGVGNLLGLGDTQSASPSASPSPSESATTTTPATTTAPTKSTGSTATTGTTKTKSAATAATTTSTATVPCLGARVLGLLASNDDIPVVAAKAGLLETASLTMYDSTYDGVVELPTDSGTTIKSLKFSMSKAVNTPFSLIIDEPDGGQTVIKSDELTVDTNVKFYTSRFEGKLFGVIPVVFTPDSPPPLTLPILWFTDAKIQLNLVRSDTLTGKPLNINELG